MKYAEIEAIRKTLKKPEDESESNFWTRKCISEFVVESHKENYRNIYEV